MSLETIDFRYIPLEPTDRVLDLGCGEGRHTISAGLQGAGHCIGLDLSQADLMTARHRAKEFTFEDTRTQLDFTVASGLNLPFRDATFDKVICSEVLEHVPDYQAVLREIYRVLKPGGLFAVSVPRFVPEWMCWQLSHEYHEVEGGHIRIFRTRQLRHAIESLSMHYLARHWAHSLHVPYWWLKCLFWSETNERAPVRLYHRFLIWDLMQQPRLTYWLDRLLNPIMGKSLVMYFQRESQ